MVWSFIWALLQKLGPFTAAGAVALAVWGGVERVQLAVAHSDTKQAQADLKLEQTKRQTCDLAFTKETGIALQEGKDLQLLARTSDAKIKTLDQAAADSRSARASAATAVASIQQIKATGARTCPSIDALIAEAK